jgi:hypothetical protein
MFLVSKLLWSNGYEFFKMLIVYFLLIKLIPIFYDTYIMYSQLIFIKKIYLLFFNNPKFKKISSGYDC